jgi:hypothetical protein
MPELLWIDLQGNNNKKATNLFVNNTLMSVFDTLFKFNREQENTLSDKIYYSVRRFFTGFETPAFID